MGKADLLWTVRQAVGGEFYDQIWPENGDPQIIIAEQANHSKKFCVRQGMRNGLPTVEILMHEWVETENEEDLIDWLSPKEKCLAGFVIVLNDGRIEGCMVTILNVGGCPVIVDFKKTEA